MPQSLSGAVAGPEACRAWRCAVDLEKETEEEVEKLDVEVPGLLWSSNLMAFAMPLGRVVHMATKAPQESGARFEEDFGMKDHIPLEL